MFIVVKVRTHNSQNRQVKQLDQRRLQMVVISYVTSRRWGYLDPGSHSWYLVWCTESLVDQGPPPFCTPCLNLSWTLHLGPLTSCLIQWIQRRLGVYPLVLLFVTKFGYFKLLWIISSNYFLSKSITYSVLVHKPPFGQSFTKSIHLH